MMPIERHTGLIWEPKENTAEQQFALDELYRSLDRSIPATYDARAKGNNALCSYLNFFLQKIFFC